MKTVGIIGAGAAGLCALHHVLETPEFVPVVWEHSSQLGGTWVYTPETGKDRHGFPIHSSMYSNLRTNIPKEVMGFPDFPFKSGGRSFVHHSEVLQYLNEFADHFSLREWIKFDHHVRSVERIEEKNGETAWEVTIVNLEDGTESVTVCDVIFVCNGHYSVPHIPEIEGMKSFRGGILHSHDYRHSVPYTDRQVVVLGAAASGLDISLEVSKVADKVYISHNFPAAIPSKLPCNVTQVKGIKKTTPSGFVLMDDSEIEANDLILCTGYEYSFPFLMPSCEVVVEGNIVKPLYKHIIHINYPTMAFIGVAYQILPFPLFNLQIQFFLKTLTGDLTLPSKEKMESETELEYKAKLARGMASRHFHRLEELQWMYAADLAAMAGLNPLPSVIESMYRNSRKLRIAAVATYKETDYRFTGQNSFESTFEGVP